MTSKNHVCHCPHSLRLSQMNGPPTAEVKSNSAPGQFGVGRQAAGGANKTNNNHAAGLPHRVMSPARLSDFFLLSYLGYHPPLSPKRVAQAAPGCDQKSAYFLASAHLHVLHVPEAHSLVWGRLMVVWWAGWRRPSYCSVHRSHKLRDFIITPSALWSCRGELAKREAESCHLISPTLPAHSSSPTLAS